MMNRFGERDLSSKASRETFLAHLHEYLVQSGCANTADALVKEASLRFSGDVQDSFFYDWWCSLLSLHNFAGTQQQPQNNGPDVSASINSNTFLKNWDDVAVPPPVAGIPANMANLPNTGAARSWMNQQTFKVPANVRFAQGPASTQPVPVVSVAASRPPPKVKAKVRKSPAHSKPANKGSPILVPGVAPLVVPRNTTATPSANGSTGRGGSTRRLSSNRSAQPNTPKWDNSPLASESYPNENGSQRGPQSDSGFTSMPQIVEPRGVLPQNLTQHSNPKSQQHNPQNPSQNQPPGTPSNNDQQIDQQHQFLQHQQALQQQQQFLQLQQQQQQHQNQQQNQQHQQHQQVPNHNHNQHPQHLQPHMQNQHQHQQPPQHLQAHTPSSRQAHPGGPQAGLMGGNPPMGQARGSMPVNGLGGPGPVGDGSMMMQKSDPMNGIIPNDANFLDEMIGGNMYANGGLNFPAEASLDGLPFDPSSSRPMSGGNAFSSNGEMYGTQQGVHPKQEVNEKLGDHAGMNSNGSISGDNFMSANFGFDMNPSMVLGGPEENGLPSDVSQGNYRMGSNYGFGGDSNTNGDFFLDAPLTMSL